MCSVCSKKHLPHEKHIHQPVEGRHHHHLEVAEPQKRGKSRQASAPLASKKTIVNPSATAQDDNPSTESLHHILGVLEQEFRDSKQWAAFETKCRTYNQLVKQYEMIAESMSSQAISESTGSSTLKAIGDDLRHVIQNMEAKVRDFFDI